jgi:hypothetical protein
MDTQMSEKTRKEVLAKMRGRYARAGRQYKGKIIDEVVELFGYHRKAAIRALRPKNRPLAPAIVGRPKIYHPEKMLPPIKAIWLRAMQPCGLRLAACMKDWLPAYEAFHKPLDADLREQLLEASRATLDRLLIPLRVAHRRRATTRPGGLLRSQIAIRTDWPEQTPGYLEMDTVALCGGQLDDRHGWMLGAVDIHTTWCVVRGLPNRSQDSVCGQMEELRGSLPFELRGLDSDNGGEFINHQLKHYCQSCEPEILFTRCRAYHKNDQAHIEQKNFTHIRQWFGYERYDHEPVWPLINELCRGPLHQLTNWYLPTMKLEYKKRIGSRTVRHYTPTQTPLERVLDCPQVSAEVKEELRRQKAASNPFELGRQIDQQLRQIERVRRPKQP